MSDLREAIAEAIEAVRDVSDDCAGIEASEKYADAALAVVRQRIEALPQGTDDFAGEDSWLCVDVREALAAR